ncbi:MAG: winged helix-turn-helix transcriptional regulator [Oscillospiraceae bacterium]|nr:winged helix-turn-helix transcriptional regulator [Oscillospiraceae bacterium]
MELNWMGRYRELVRAIVYYSNSSNRNLFTANRRRSPSDLSMHEYQILEYICEFENENRIMAEISRDTGIAQSIITKATKHLIALGLVERYRLGNNRKSIVLLPTEDGRAKYLEIALGSVAPAFAAFFRSLESFDGGTLAVFEDAIRTLGTDWAKVGQEPGAEPRLTKIEE